MKLHLPKQLFTALLAALTLGSTAWGSTGWAARQNLSGTGLYIGGTGTAGTTQDGILFVTESTPSGGVLTTFVEKVDVAAGKPSLTEFYIVADKGDNEGVNAEIRELIVNSGTTIGVDVSGWGSGRVFSDLEIEKLTIGTEEVPGTAVLNVSVNHCVTVGGTTGSLSSVNNAGTLTLGAVTLSGNVTNSGTLTLGAVTLSGNVTNSGTLTLGAVTLSGDVTNSDTVTNSGTLIIAGTLSGTGTLTNNDNGKVKVDTTNFCAFDGLNYTTADGETNNVKAGFLIGEQKLQVLGEGVTYTGEVYINDSETGTTLTNGAVTTTIGADAHTFYVNDAWTYDAEVSDGATAFYVASAGTLNLGTLGTITENDTTKYSLPAPIHNAGNVTLSASTEGVTAYLNDLFSAAAITQTATGTTTITGAVSMNEALSVSGTVKISNAASFANNEKTLTLDKLVLENVTEAIINGTNSNTGKVSGTIEVLGKSKLILTGKQDLLGWSGYDYTDKILLRGTDADNLATLQLNTRQTCSTAIVMEGYSTILNGGNAAGDSANDDNAGTLQMHDYGSITATGTNNTFSAILYTNKATTIAVTGAGDKLLIDGVVRGSSAITKTGDGTLTFSGDMSRQSGTINVNDGIVVLDDAATLGSSAYVVANGAELQVSGVTRETFSNAVSGAGTLTKTGAGTLTLTNATAVNLNVAGGKLVYELADNAEAAVDKTLGSLVVSSGAAFEKSGAGTLNIGNLHSATLDGDIVVSDGVLQFNGYGTDTTTEDNVVVPPRFVQLVQHLTTTGTGKVDITGRVSFNWTGTHAGVRGCTIGSYISIEDDLQINTHASNADADGDTMCRWEVVDGGRLEVGDVLWLTNRQKLVVDGGTVTAAGGLHLGHEVNSGSLNSKAVIRSGSLATQNITLIGNKNAVQMIGGTLTFTPATDGGEVLIDGKTTSSSAGAGTLDFTGGTLAATTAGWTLTGTEAMAVSLGNVEFDIAAGKTVTLAGIYNLTGTLGLTGNTVTEGETTTTGTLALTGTMNIGAIEVLKEQNVSYTAGDNGFAVGAFYLVENKDSANITTTGLTVNLAGTSVAASDITLSETGSHLLLSYSGKDVYYVNSGTVEATDTIGSTTGFDHYYVAQGATLSITQSEASLSDSNAKSALLSATGSGTIVYANAANETLICGTGMSDLFTGTLDLSQGTIYVGNKPGTSDLDNAGGDTNFDASRVIVRADGAFWTHLGGGSAESGKIFAADFDLMNGAELNNRDGHVHYTGDIRFNVENPAAADSGFSSNGVVSFRQYWGKTLEYSGRLSGDGTVQMYATTAPATAGAPDTKAFYKLSGADNTFRGTYELVNSTDPVQRTTTLILANATAAQFATVKLSSTDSLAVLQLNQDATIKGLDSTDADNKVTTTAAATLTVSEGDFAGKLENGSATNILSLKKTGTGTLTLSGSNSYTGTTTVEGGELIISSAASLGTGNMTVNQGGTLTLDVKGALTFGTASRVSGAGTLKIADGTTLTMTPTEGATAVVGSTIAVAGGGRLILDGNDRLSWNGANPTGAIVLTGEADGETPKYATLELGGRQTQTTDIEMKGYAQIVKTTDASGSLNPYKYNGASLTVEGQHNTVSANLEMRDALLVNVKENGKLEVSGAVSMHTGGSLGTANGKGYETGSVVKLGAGDLEFSNDSNNFAKKYVNQAGKTLISGNSTFGNEVSVTGGTFEVNSVSTINGAVSNSSNLTVSGGRTTFNGAVSNSANLAVSGGTTTFNGAVSNSSNLTVSGGAATFNGAVTNTAASSVTAGTASFAGGLELGGSGASLTVSGGRADVTGALTVSGTEASLSQSREGVLNLSGDITINAEAGATFNGAVGIGSTITNNGTLTLNDSITIIGELSAFTQRGEATESYQLANGTSSENNGFRVISGASYWLTSEGSTGTTNVAEGITTVQHGNASYNLNQDDGGEGEGSTNNWYFQVESNVGKVYYISSGDVVVDSAVQAAATGGYVLSGGNMQLTGGTVNTASMSYSAGTITMTDGATLNVDSTLVTDDTNNTQLLNTVLKGSGDVRFHSGFEITENLTSGFSGNLIVQNEATLTLGGERAHDLSGFSEVALEDRATLKLAYGTGVSAGTITLNEGTKLHLQNGNGANNTVNATLLVNGKATLQAGHFGDATVVDGSISGQGTLTVTRDLKNSFALDSDISDAVDGSLKLAFDNITAETGKQVTLSGSNTYTGGTTLTGGNLKTTSVNALGKGSVQVNEGGRLMVAENLKLEDSLQISGSGTTEVAAGKSLNLQDKVSLSSTDGTNAATLTAKTDANALARLKEDASFTIEDMTLTNTTITAATPTTQVNFSNVTVEGATVLRNLQAAMTNASVGMGGQDGARTYTATTSLLSGITLNNKDVAGSTITVDLGDLAYTAPMGPSGKYDLTITLSGFTMQDYTQGIVFAADSWLGQLLSQPENADVQVSFSSVEAVAAAAESGAATGVSYSTGNVGTVITITGLNVPEPATSALSLLALAALAARRRRK